MYFARTGEGGFGGENGCILRGGDSASLRGINNSLLTYIGDRPDRLVTSFVKGYHFLDHSHKSLQELGRIAKSAIR